MESILNELQDSHLNSSNPLRSDKVTWVFNHTIKSLKLVISIVNFQMAITQLNLGRFAKSQTFLKSSLNALQDSCIGSWIWLRLRGVMKGFSRVISYCRTICISIISCPENFKIREKNLNGRLIPNILIKSRITKPFKWKYWQRPDSGLCFNF